jgi:hypothetical protein
MAQNHTALPGKFMKGKLRHAKSDLDLRHSSSNSFSGSKPISVKKDTPKFDVHVGRASFQKEYNLVLLGQASVGKSGMHAGCEYMKRAWCVTHNSLSNIGKFCIINLYK